VRPQQAADEHGADAFSAASGPFSQDAPGTSLNPDAPIESSTQTEPDVRPETRSAAAVLAPADAAALAHLLVARQPLDEILAQALAVGARICHGACAFRLFARQDDDDTLVLRPAAALGYASDDTQTVSGEAAEVTASLGHGAHLDRQVLRDHLAVRAADILYIPLVTADDVLAGVLSITRRATTRRPLDQAVTALLADHLTVLLERSLRERTTARLRAELPGLTRLADPSHVAAPAASSVPTSEREAEDRLLLEAAELVRRVALPRALVTLALSPEGRLLVVHAGAGGKSSPVAPEQAAILLAALHTGGPHVISTRADAATWHALASLLHDTMTGAAGADGESGQLTLLPVVSGDAPLGLFLLGHSANAPASEPWLPLAAAIASTAATGIHALRYAAAAASEARSRDTYISLAAHELRSPLTSIKGYAQLLTRQSRKHPLPDTMVRSVEAIEQQSMRMAEMVGELLDASRIQRGKLELMPSRVDLLPLATRAVDNLRTQLPQQEIALEIEQPSLMGNWDPQRVEQIVRDLLDNAVRFSPEGNPIHVRVAREDGLALVSVRDDGIGIADGDRERIFDYLYRAPSAEQRNLSGLGLGLYICRHLSERMGGSLVLYATSIAEPSGSEFHLHLPLAESS
jgi:signal transduction histidine kinase